MRMITQADIATLLQQFRQQYPSFSLVYKPLTSTRCTTVGSTIYLPTTWETLPVVQQYWRLRHEEVHLGQFAQFGTWTFLWRYAWASGRCTLEQPAFAAEMQAVCETLGVDVLRQKRQYYLSQFTGSAYWSMWDVASATAWVDAQMAQCAQETV